jgi:hypothetical protein
MRQQSGTRTRLAVLVIGTSVMSWDWWVHNPPGMWAQDDYGIWREYTVYDSATGECADNYGNTWKCGDAILRLK